MRKGERVRGRERGREEGRERGRKGEGREERRDAEKKGIEIVREIKMRCLLSFLGMPRQC